MSNLYIIAGCNGAGKTTASFTVLPEMLDCDEFINADEIARGLAPLNPEKAAIEAGRLMLTKIDKLISNKKDFAFETTLATKSYVKTILKAQENGYQVSLVYFWLDSVELAIRRVQTRVLEGGHNIPEEVINRRYFSGIENLFKLYIPICDYWMIFDNSGSPTELIAEGYPNGDIEISNPRKLEILKG
ncbi:MAG: AAA family ATPase [Bacteroidetes bacterium]|nr:AAA family ATPase [Bacteroidota bacterium]